MRTLPIDYLRSIFTYNKDTGDLVWNSRPESHFKNKQAYTRFVNNFEGKIASRVHKGAGNKQSYIKLSIDSTDFYAHRVVWAIYYGEWPETIDHINGNGLDNRIENLRSVSMAENNRNAPVSSSNTSGVVGVSFDNTHRKWVASIGSNGKTRVIGRFKYKSDAVAARKMAERIGGYHKNHGRK